MVEQLLTYGADINLCEDHQWTPLHAACKAGDTRMVEQLVQAGSNITHVAENDTTCLYIGECTCSIQLCILYV